MGKKRKQLSQEEIWDDTELLDSWHEAKLEYQVDQYSVPTISNTDDSQLYHSIDARGERVEDVLRQEEAADGLKLDTDANDTVDNAQPSSVQQEGLADIGMEDGEGNGLSPRVSATEQIEVLLIN